MNKITILLAILIVLFITGCVKTTYVEILEPDQIYYGGKIDFNVEPGDTLKIISSKTCRGGRGTCWEVWDIDKKKTGMVSKQRMEERHKVYQKEE